MSLIIEKSKTIPGISYSIHIGLSAAIEGQQGDVAAVVGKSLWGICVTPLLPIHQPQQHISVAGAKGDG